MVGEENIETMNAIILAGGKSSRMGFDKAFIKLKGRPLIERQIKVLKSIFQKIIIVTNKPNDYKFKRVKAVKDIMAGRGALSGIYTGLIASDSFYNFVIACDMPNLNLKLIKYMLRQKGAFDVVVPHIKKGYETLFAIYSKDCIMPIYKTIISENLRIRNFFKKVNVREIKEDDVKRFGSPNILFMNINTPSDLTRIHTD